MAVTALLCIALGTVTFRIGKNTGFELARLEERNGPTQAAATEAPSTVHASPPPSEEELAARDVALTELRREIAQKSAELAKLKAQQTEQQTILDASAEDEKRLKQVSAERDRLLLQVSADEETLHAAEARLEKLERERSEFAIHTASLETKNNELSASLAEQQRLTAEQQALLAKDRDIRELVGARNLTMSPLLVPGTFVQIDVKQNYIRRGPSIQSPGQSHFARAIYFLDIRTGYACGYCELKDGILTLIPHPDSGERIKTFKYPSEVTIVGRVTGIAMRIEEDKAFRGKESKKPSKR
jgi:hypothetical protein